MVSDSRRSYDEHRKILKTHTQMLGTSPAGQVVAAVWTNLMGRIGGEEFFWKLHESGVAVDVLKQLQEEANRLLMGLASDDAPKQAVGGGAAKLKKRKLDEKEQHRSDPTKIKLEKP